jgi:hypothetical protein
MPVCFLTGLRAGWTIAAPESQRPMSSPRDTPQGASGPGQDGLRYGLPFRQGKGFATLDDYLAPRHELGACDV